MKLNNYIYIVLALLFTGGVSYAQKQPYFDIGKEFTPYGFMGCMTKINLIPVSKENPHTEPSCFKIQFGSSCKGGWAGSYWLNKSGAKGDNWGQYSGLNLSNKGYTKVTFWARGLYGNEIIKFGSGGIDNTGDNPKAFKYKDSYGGEDSGINKFITLTRDWKQYSIDLTGKNLSSVIGGFFWSVDWQKNPTGVTFFLDDIRFE